MKKTLLITLICLFFSACIRKNPAKLYQKALASADQGNWRQVEKYASDAVSAKKDSPLYNSILAIAYIHLGKSDKAVEQLSTFDDCQNSDILYLYANALYQEKHFKKAYSNLKKAYIINNENLYVLELLVLCSLKLKSSEGIKYIEKLVKTKKYKGSAIAYNNLGVLYAYGYDYPRAMRYLMYAKNKDKDNPSVLLNLAITNDERKMSRRAILFYRYFIAASKADFSIDIKNKAIARLHFLCAQSKKNN